MLFFFCDKKPLTVLLIMLSCLASISAHGDDEFNSGKVKQTTGQPTVVIDSNSQTLSGIKILPVKAVVHHAEFETIGKIISIQPLLALRERYLVAQAELLGAKARLRNTGQRLMRQQELFKHGIAAKRSLQEQEALGSSDQALVDAGQVRQTTIANEARLLWGTKLAEWIMADNSRQWADLLSGRQYLAQVTLPANKHLPDAVKTIALAPSGQRSKAYSATLVSQSTQVDNSQQGDSYFFMVSGANLRAGMKVMVWVVEDAPEQFGVIVPESALIWYMDQVYIYIKTDKDSFSRRAIKHFSNAPEGYFVEGDIKADAEVVTQGGQMLLSEELRGQMQDED
ncbi:MAG: hypothetical protein ABL933_01220 [Methyloglobulus sp.]|nr:hypothetical protein [Methyloglobulus sp.]